MDDCSSDGSVKILEEYTSKRPRTHLVLNEENSGSPFKQWMKGASMAKGKYLWIAESDDIALPGLLRRNVEMMTAHPKAVISFCQSIFVNERSEELHSFGENYRFVYKTIGGTRISSATGKRSAEAICASQQHSQRQCHPHTERGV